MGCKMDLTLSNEVSSPEFDIDHLDTIILVSTQFIWGRYTTRTEHCTLENINPEILEEIKPYLKKAIQEDYIHSDEYKLYLELKRKYEEED